MLLLKKEEKRCEKVNLCEVWMAGVLYSGIVHSMPVLVKLVKEVLDAAAANDCN